MELITNSKKLEIEFQRLIDSYSSYYWATAWAGVNSKHFDGLNKNIKKIKKIIVGIHFYQTHPDFIETFINNKSVHFVNQPRGTFHPKLYLFHNTDNNWEALIGSSNFTKEAFNKNTEANVLISSNDENSVDFLQKAFQLINSSWAVSKTFNETDLINYRKVWNIQRYKIQSLSGMYGNKIDDSIPIHEVPVVNMSWGEFILRIKENDSHGIDRRLKVIETAQQLFSSVNHFMELNENQRRFIGGAKSVYAEDSKLFGSMVGRGDYIHEIIVNNKSISLALDQIPLGGQIIRKNYIDFVEHFENVFPGNYIGVASRLLTMKRPDVFYCLTSKNQDRFCKDFKIRKSEINYDGYWEQVIARIYDSEWWLNPEPNSEQEQKISNFRAAFLDAIYYEQ
jgi:hypothetical protein